MRRFVSALVPGAVFAWFVWLAVEWWRWQRDELS